MNSEEDEFRRIEAEAKRRAARDEDDDTQVYAKPCIGKDPRCPCQDGDACHYKDCGSTKALPVPAAQPEQKPVAFYHPHKGFYWAKPTHISAPTVVDVPPVPLYVKWKATQRPWQGLEAEEILDLFDRNNVYGSKWIEFARTVEAKLKKRNCE